MRVVRARENESPENVDSEVDNGEDGEIGPPSIFGGSAESKRPDPGVNVSAKKAAPVKTAAPVKKAAPAKKAAPGEAAVVQKRWFKQLSDSDSQQVRPGSNPTGALRLNRAHHDIDWRTYFRRDFLVDFLGNQTCRSWVNRSST